MRLTSWGLSVVVLATAGFAQSGMVSSHPLASPHGLKPSSRVQFAQECGISDPGPQKATGLTRSTKGMWSVVDAQHRPADTDSAVARIWHEKKWMIDMHESGGSGDWMHTAQMCFADNGEVNKIIDRYMDMPKCGCVRFTETTYGPDGKVVSQKQDYYNGRNAERMPSTPEAAKNFAAPFEFKKLEQLPFYGFVKGNK